MAGNALTDYKYNNLPIDRRLRTDDVCNGVANFEVCSSISYKDDKSPNPVSSPQLMSDKNELYKIKQQYTNTK